MKKKSKNTNTKPSALSRIPAHLMISDDPRDLVAALAILAEHTGVGLAVDGDVVVAAKKAVK